MEQTLVRPNDDRVGILCREGFTIYYAFINGNYFEHPDLEEVEFNLRLSDRQLREVRQ